MSIIVPAENNFIKLPPNVHTTDGTQANVVLPGDELRWMLKYAGFIAAPADMTVEHNHYAHGTSKRSKI